MAALNRLLRRGASSAGRRMASLVSEAESRFPASLARRDLAARRRPGDRSVQWVFLGCPGVGKGTYASRLSNLIAVPHIATGDLVREELASSGPMSHQVMTANPECATLDTTILAALHIMHDGKFLHVHVVDKDGNIAACLDVLQLTHAAISMYDKVLLDTDTNEGDKVLLDTDTDLVAALNPMPDYLCGS